MTALDKRKHHWMHEETEYEDETHERIRCKVCGYSDYGQFRIPLA